jgi:hypothetical protein
MWLGEAPIGLMLETFHAVGPWEEEKHQIDDPVRLRRRAANLERELAAAPARESTLAFLRGILEEVRFALDSPLEGAVMSELVSV